MSAFTFQDGVTPQDAAHMNLLEQTPRKGVANGYPSLDSGGKVPVAQLPTLDTLKYDGDYTPVSYAEGEIVIYNQVAYLCVTPTSSPPTPWPGGPTPLPPATLPTYGTTLPASPTDGQEAILVDSVTNPSYQWRFRYNASSSSTYKWEFVGGADAFVQNTPNVTQTTTSTWQELDTAMRITLARAGDYLVAITAQLSNGGSALGQATPWDITAGTQIGAGSAASVSNSYATITRAGDRLVGVAAGHVIGMEMWTNLANTVWTSRVLRIQPLRVA